MENYEAYNAILQAGDRFQYQAAVLVSAALGGWFIRRDSLDWPLPASTRIAILAVGALGSLVGCAVPAFVAGGYVGSLASDVLLSPKTILGGMLFGFFAVALWKRSLGVSYDTSDAFARGGCLMMLVGRLGCIAQHCCFGRPTTLWFGYDFGDGIPRFPVQALEALLLFALFVVLDYCHRRSLFPHRRLFILFALYGGLRFGLEFLREEVAARWLGLGFYQWLALALFVVGSYQVVLRTAKLRGQVAMRPRVSEAPA